MFGSLAGGLFRVPAVGGQPTPLTTLDTSEGASSHRLPSFLPDGRHFVYLAYPANTIWLGSLDAKETTRLFTADSQAQYAVPGYLLFARQGTLMAQPFDARRLKPAGEAFPIAEQLALDANGGAAFSASENGDLTYRTGTTLNAQTQLRWADHTGKSIGLLGQPGVYRNPTLSPDGTRLAVEMADSQGRNLDIWLLDVARGTPSRFTFDPHNDIYPVWSPDGSRIAFGSDRENGAFNLYQKLSNGATGEELLLKSTSSAAPYSWSPDGRFILYRNLLPTRFFNIGLLPLFGDRKPRLFQQSNFVQTTGQVSSDGRWVAYNSNESGRYEVYVQTFPTPGGKWQISRDGGLFPRWRSDGKELFYYAADEQLMAVPIKGETALEVGAATSLFKARLLNGPAAAVGFRQQYDVTRDGQRFLLNVPSEDSVSSSITVVLNWPALLKK